MRYGFALLPVVALLLTSCEPDPATVKDVEKINKWIYSQMESNYLWASQMPSLADLNLNRHPELFFGKDLLYRDGKDNIGGDRFSTIVYTGSADSYPIIDDENATYASLSARSGTVDFGFDARVTSGTSTYCQVISVTPGSPAAKAGVRRGDCFSSIGGKSFSSSGEYRTLMSGSSATLDIFYPPGRDTITLYKSTYRDTPVIFDTIYQLEPRTGYVVYNHFTAGTNNSFLEEIKSVFTRFKQEGVKAVILDLRYNSGGEVDAGINVAALLAPHSTLGEALLYKERHSSYGNPERFEVAYLPAGSAYMNANPDTEILYIITSRYTASASEMLLHCLKPLMADRQLVHIGQTTYGKNVATMSIVNKSYTWQLNPVIMRIYNVDKVSGFESGIAPDYYCDELLDAVHVEAACSVYPIGEFGDIENEKMLRLAMDMIHGPDGWRPEDLDTDEGGSEDLDRNGLEGSLIGDQIRVKPSIASRSSSIPNVNHTIVVSGSRPSHFIERQIVVPE